MPASDSNPPSEEPVCPFCQKGPVTTTSKKLNDATYWRCHACGQIWNPSRLAAVQKRRW
jgi:transposase-like protein